MGILLSCCGRRRKVKDEERKPLLRDQTRSAYGQPHNSLEKLADVLAAVRAGKLPSQDQLNRALQWAVRSRELDVEHCSKRHTLGQPLGDDRRKLIEDVRQLVEALLQLGLEKNNDDLLQDLVYQARRLSAVPICVNASIDEDSETVNELKAAASAIPSEEEAKTDIAALISSAQTLVSLLFTSAAFRLLLTDVLNTAREFVANAAGDVAQVAEVVGGAAEIVEANIRPGIDADPAQIDALRAKAEHAQHQAARHREQLPTPDTKEVFLNRVEDIIRQAQAHPSYNASLRTLLYLFRKYAHRVQLASSAMSNAGASVTVNGLPLSTSTPLVIPDPAFTKMLSNLKTLLERFASHRPLDPLLAQLATTMRDVLASPADSLEESNPARDFFRDVGVWLDSALGTDPQAAKSSYASSAKGRKEAARLYDRGRVLFASDPTATEGDDPDGVKKVSRDVRALVQEAEAFTQALRNDRSTGRLLSALDSLQGDARAASVHGARAAQSWRLELARLALNWVVHVLREAGALRAVPMPRVEYVDTSLGLEAALDTLVLSLEAELVPDRVRVAESTEVLLDVGDVPGNDAPLHPHSATSASQAHIGEVADDDADVAVRTVHKLALSLAGLRLAVYDAAYYVRYAYKGSRWLAYADEGLLSIIVGTPHKRGSGLALDIELELDVTSGQPPPLARLPGEPSFSSTRALLDFEQPEGTDEDRKTLFRVTSVKADVPDLGFRIARSRHWILNSITQLLLGPILRKVVRKVLEQQVRSALEKLGQWCAGVEEKAAQKSKEREGGREGASAEDYWAALMEVLGKSPAGGSLEEEDEDEDESEEDDAPDTYTETHTKATLKGFVRTTYTQPEPPPSSSSPPSPTEQTLALGVGTQVLPGKGEPLDRATPGEVARGVVEHVSEDVEQVQEGVEGAVGSGVQETARLRREVEGAEERATVRRGMERKRGGWRSRAFDF